MATSGGESAPNFKIAELTSSAVSKGSCVKFLGT